MLGLQDILNITAKTAGSSVISGLYDARLPTAKISVTPLEYAREFPGPDLVHEGEKFSRNLTKWDVRAFSE
jgi:hypothetical protein